MTDRNQRYLLQSGGWWALYDGLTAGYLLAYALALGASNTIIGIIGALPYLAMMLAEIPGAKLLEHFTRLRIYAIASTFARLSWLGIIFAPSIFAQSPLLGVVLFFFLARFFDYMSDPAWTVLVADVVPNRIRGDFVARRTRLINIGGMIALVAAGQYLDLFAPGDFAGFLTVFAVGIGFGIATTLCTLKVKEPPYQDHDHHGWREFFQLEGEFKRYVTFAFLFNFAFMLASPFFTAYILNDLGLSYTIFALSTALTNITKILVFRHVGKLSDRFGDKPVLWLSVIGTALVPLTFLFVTRDTLWLLWFAQVLSGIVWAGYDVAVFNVFLDLTTPSKRAIQTATYSIITGVPLIIAPILGGFIADNVTLVLTGIPLVFAVSAVLRLLSSLFLVGIREHRVKHDYPLAEVLWHAFELHPSRGIQHRWHGIVRGMRKKALLFTTVFK
ncbi:MFS transporter [Candidatus Woesearchaeota archaeon]|nr:MFS transporter [Candidatus Woesearchaeota archaeon]